MTSRTPKSFSFEAVTTGGAVKLLDRGALLAWASQVGDGIELVGKFEIAEATRSARANAYYWGVVLKLAAESCGQSADDIHDAMCAKFIPNEHKRVEFFNKLTNERLEVEVDIQRSSDLNRAEFYDFVELVRVWVAEFLGVTTPDPDPNYWRKSKSSAHAAAGER